MVVTFIRLHEAENGGPTALTQNLAAQLETLITAEWTGPHLPDWPGELPLGRWVRAHDGHHWGNRDTFDLF